jgi:hypothetical protein
MRKTLFKDYLSRLRYMVSCRVTVHIQGVVHDISEILEARRDFEVPKPILLNLLGWPLSCSIKKS